MKWKLLFLSALICSALQLQQANAQQVRVTFENLQPTGGGFSLTPVFAGFHDGTFDVFNEGEASSIALEMLAEDGFITTDGGLEEVFAAAQPSGQQSIFANPAGFTGLPVLDPTESVSQVFNLDSNSRFFNFATMVIPTNDSFFGNDEAIEIFDAAGVFTGNQTIELSAAQIWDAGTEVNDGLGAAFSAEGGTSSDEGSVVTLGPDLSNLDDILTAAGDNIDFAAASSSPFLRVTISAVPEPSSLALLGAFSLVGVLRRRR